MKPKPSLSDVINIRLKTFAFGSAFAFAVLAASVIAAFVLYQKIETQNNVLKGLRGNVTQLAQNSDYREIERVLGSYLTSSPGAEIRLIREGRIEVSVPNSQEMFSPETLSSGFSVLGVFISRDFRVSTSVPLIDDFSHASFGFLKISTSLRPILAAFLISFLVSLITLGAILFWWRKLVHHTVLKELAPLSDLHEDVRKIGRGEAPKLSAESFEILELADMSAALHTQFKNVQDLTETNAKSEGERRAKEGVKSLMHDLLNPYTAIANLVQGSILFPDDTALRNELNNRFPSLNDQIKNLLKAARHIEVETPKKIKSDLMETVVEGARQGSVKNPGALKLLPSHRTFPILHDPELLSRAIANLVRNSIEEGASEVRVWLEENASNIHIHDNGPGIPKEKVAALFEGRLKTSKPDGSGIGFPTALRLVRLHDGRILLVPTENSAGAHLKIELPSTEQTI